MELIKFGTELRIIKEIIFTTVVFTTVDWFLNLGCIKESY